MLNYLRGGTKRMAAIWWLLVIVTVFTFLLGFNFFGGLGGGQFRTNRVAGEVGTVDGRPITLPMWQEAQAQAEAQYRQKFNAVPTDRDLDAVREQAWRNLVNEMLFAELAHKAGLQATDAEILTAMRTNPPALILQQPAFQTNGQFDVQKYYAALQNPDNHWSAFEDMLREQVPVRKLQERLLASLKLSQGELKQDFLDRYERMSVTALIVPPADSGRVAGTEQELAKVYDQYKTRLASPARTQLEVLAIEKKFGTTEVGAAMDLAKSLFDRASKGEDFAALARDYSEGPSADKGGVVDRWLSPQDLGPIVGEMIKAHKPGDVVFPYREKSRVMIFRILDPARDTAAAKPPFPGAVKLAQIIIKVHPSNDELRDQYQTVEKIRARARAVGLSKAATENGLATTRTSWFDDNNPPQQLFMVPAAPEWGLHAKKGEISPVFEGMDEFVVAQVAAQHAPGIPTRDEVQDQLKFLADAEHRVDLAKPRADAVGNALRGGSTLEAAATSQGLQVFSTSMTRQQPDPRLAGNPDLAGQLWGSAVGKVVGPLRTPAGWFYGRKDGQASPPDTLFNDTVRGQITSDVLTRRQQAFFTGYVDRLRENAKVVDLRTPSGQ